MGIGAEIIQLNTSTTGRSYTELRSELAHQDMDLLRITKTPGWIDDSEVMEHPLFSSEGSVVRTNLDVRSNNISTYSKVLNHPVMLTWKGTGLTNVYGFSNSILALLDHPDRELPGSLCHKAADREWFSTNSLISAYAATYDAIPNIPIPLRHYDILEVGDLGFNEFVEAKYVPQLAEVLGRTNAEVGAVVAEKLNNPNFAPAIYSYMLPGLNLRLTSSIGAIWDGGYEVWGSKDKLLNAARCKNSSVYPHPDLDTIITAKEGRTEAAVAQALCSSLAAEYGYKVDGLAGETVGEVMQDFWSDTEINLNIASEFVDRVVGLLCKTHAIGFTAGNCGVGDAGSFTARNVTLGGFVMDSITWGRHLSISEEYLLSVEKDWHDVILSLSAFSKLVSPKARIQIPELFRDYVASQMLPYHPAFDASSRVGRRFQSLFDNNE